MLRPRVALSALDDVLYLGPAERGIALAVEDFQVYVAAVVGAPGVQARVASPSYDIPGLNEVAGRAEDLVEMEVGIVAARCAIEDDDPVARGRAQPAAGIGSGAGAALPVAGRRDDDARVEGADLRTDMRARPPAGRT